MFLVLCNPLHIYAIFFPLPITDILGQCWSQLVGESTTSCGGSSQWKSIDYCW